jgi:hypothetical protein
MAGESLKDKKTESTTSTQTFYGHGDTERFTHILKEDLAEIFLWDTTIKVDENARQEKREAKEIKRYNCDMTPSRYSS